MMHCKFAASLWKRGTVVWIGSRPAPL